MNFRSEDQSFENNDDHILTIIRIYRKLFRLKELYRRGWINHGIPKDVCESVGEHILSTTLLSLIVCDYAYSYLDREKIMMMSLLHDVGEIYTGDIIPDDGIPSKKKVNLERDSFLKVIRHLPNAEEYYNLWEEYILLKSPEAIFVNQIDKLDMALQALIYQKHLGVEMNDFFKSAQNKIHDPLLLRFLEIIVSE